MELPAPSAKTEAAAMLVFFGPLDFGGAVDWRERGQEADDDAGEHEAPRHAVTLGIAAGCWGRGLREKDEGFVDNVHGEPLVDCAIGDAARTVSAPGSAGGSMMGIFALG